MATHLKSFDLVGKKEEVADYISMLDPTDTPFLSNIGTEKIGNTLYTWHEDQLRAVAKNAQEEGHDFADTDRDQPVPRSNGTQILSETFKVSGTADAVKLYGRKKASLREMFKTGKLLKMDLEHSLVGTAQTYVPSAAGTPGEFAGVQAQIAAGVTTNMLTNPLTETAVVEMHEKLWNEGSDADVLMVKPSDTKIIASWLNTSDRAMQIKNGETKITNVVNVYQGPFGTVRVVKNRRIKATDALMVQYKNWKLKVLRNWFTLKLAKTSDADRWSMTGEFGLSHSNQLATGLITGLT